MTATTTIKKTKRAKSVRLKPLKYYQKTFRQKIEFFIGWPAEEFRKYLDREFKYTWRNNNQAGAAVHIELADTTVIVVWVSKGQNHPWHVAHECVHAVNFIFDYCGVVPSNTNDEAQAYLLSELMRAAYDTY